MIWYLVDVLCQLGYDMIPGRCVMPGGIYDTW